MTVDIGKLANPFHVWAELARGLRQRFLAEVGDEPSPHAAEVLTEMSEIVRRCQCLGISLEHLHRHDPKAYDAFLRALETS
jgi:hypothetical protein